jgi:hypothetical protein
MEKVAQIIPAAQRAKTLIGVRDRVLFPANASSGMESLHDELNRRLLELIWVPPPSISTEETLLRVNKFFRRLCPRKAEAFALKMTDGRDPNAPIFSKYDEQFAVVASPKGFWGEGVGEKELLATCIDGIPVVPDDLLAEAKQGEKEALKTIRHEKKHAEYFRIHGEHEDLDQLLASEVQAHISALAETFGMDGLMDNVRRAVMKVKKYQIDKMKCSKSRTEDAFVRFFLAMETMVAALKSGYTGIAYDYALTATNLNQIIGMSSDTERTRFQLDRFIHVWGRFDKGFELTAADVELEAEANHNQFDRFLRAYEPIDNMP